MGFLKNSDFNSWAEKWPGTNYLNRFINLDCAADMLALKLFPNGKEVTESFAMVASVFNNLPDLSRNDPNVTVVVVGDGKRPRTAAMFAFLTKWTCYSIDPNFHKTDFPIKRLDCFKVKVEDLEPRNYGENVIVIHPHSHARCSESIKRILGDNRWLISMPCCVEDDVKRLKQGLMYRDEHVLSPKNMIYVYWL